MEKYWSNNSGYVPLADNLGTSLEFKPSSAAIQTFHIRTYV